MASRSSLGVHGAAGRCTVVFRLVFAIVRVSVWRVFVDSSAAISFLCSLRLVFGSASLMCGVRGQLMITCVCSASDLAPCARPDDQSLPHARDTNAHSQSRSSSSLPINPSLRRSDAKLACGFIVCYARKHYQLAGSRSALPRQRQHKGTIQRCFPLEPYMPDV